MAKRTLCNTCEINFAAPKSLKCYKCKSRAYRKNNPMRAAYVTLKYNAIRRGKEFTITFEYFKRFAIKTELMTNRGTKSESYTVDRIKDELGYVPGNLQVLTNEDNARKNALKKQYIFVEGVGLKVSTSKPCHDIEDYPF